MISEKNIRLKKHLESHKSRIMFKLIDAHSHINFPDFDNDRNEVIKKTLNERVGMIIVGTCAGDSAKAVEIASQYGAGVYASIGLHPTNIRRGDFDANYYRNLVKNLKVAAIGECGLDYYRNQESQISNLKSQNYKEKQKEVFKKQIKLALEVNKPLMIHCRDAHDDVLDVFKSYLPTEKQALKLRGVIHFFSGSWEQAQKYFELGFLISFTGVITFADSYNEIIKKAPLEKMMVETDAPFVAPVPYRGQRSEPLYVKEVTKKLAEIKGISYEEVAKVTTENAIKLFNLV